MTSVQFIEYPKCTTCVKAKKWLDAQGLSHSDRHIVEEKPSVEELKTWWKASGLPLKRFFNTCGMQYRALKLATKLPSMSEEEQLELLASDGMIVKRPILITDKGVTTGFKEAEWQKLLGLTPQ